MNEIFQRSEMSLPTAWAEPGAAVAHFELSIGERGSALRAISQQ